MGDRTSYTLQIRGISDAEDGYLARRLREEYEFEAADAGCYVNYEWSVGALDEFTKLLNTLQEELDNAFAFRIWEDPKYEWDGEWTGWIPGLGTASGLCDGDGTTHVTNQAILDTISGWRADLPELLRSNIQRSIGGEHIVDPAEVLAGRLLRLIHHEWEQAWAELP
jgi:hypothetical protein